MVMRNLLSETFLTHPINMQVNQEEEIYQN